VVRRTGRPEPSTNAWWSLSVVLPITFGFALLFFGFGLGSLCTDAVGNRSLHEPPCNRVDQAIKLNLAGQAVMLLVAVVVTARSGHGPTLTRWVVLGSVVIFVGMTGFARSF
jgi:hypothetical protein